jgi:hypothetical protein
MVCRFFQQIYFPSFFLVIGRETACLALNLHASEVFFPLPYGSKLPSKTSKKQQFLYFMSDFREPIQLPQLSLPVSPSDSFTSRRKVIGTLGTLGIASTALLASSGHASAGWFFGKKDQIPVVEVKTVAGDARKSTSTPSRNTGGFPVEWVQLQGGNLKTYASFINTLKLKNISAQDVISAHAKERGGVWNTLPPKQWWRRMGYTLQVVDRISSAMKCPVEEIVSAYRSPAYNARCAGAKTGSYHQANVALDVKFDTSARNVTHAARTLRDRGLFKGGVGRT